VRPAFGRRPARQLRASEHQDPAVLAFSAGQRDVAARWLRKAASGLAKRKPPITGKAAIPFIFQEINNSDKLADASLTNIFYTHNYALTGGQDMTLADPSDFYNKPVTYRTFFQQAVEEIG